MFCVLNTVWGSERKWITRTQITVTHFIMMPLQTTLGVSNWEIWWLKLLTFWLLIFQWWRVSHPHQRHPSSEHLHKKNFYLFTFKIKTLNRLLIIYLPCRSWWICLSEMACSFEHGWQCRSEMWYITTDFSEPSSGRQPWHLILWHISWYTFLKRWHPHNYQYCSYIYY